MREEGKVAGGDSAPTPKRRSQDEGVERVHLGAGSHPAAEEGVEGSRGSREEEPHDGEEGPPGRGRARAGRDRKEEEEGGQEEGAPGAHRYHDTESPQPLEWLYPEEELGKCPEKFREFYAKEKALADKVLEYEDALIKQFRTKGFAEDYTEVSDNDDEN
ncbi:unnamed protein product [Urochloa humidicola]